MSLVSFAEKCKSGNEVEPERILSSFQVLPWSQGPGLRNQVWQKLHRCKAELPLSISTCVFWIAVHFRKFLVDQFKISSTFFESFSVMKPVYYRSGFKNFFLAFLEEVCNKQPQMRREPFSGLRRPLFGCKWAFLLPNVIFAFRLSCHQSPEIKKNFLSVDLNRARTLAWLLF